MDLETLLELVVKGECEEREFKSDRRKMSDNDIYEEVVALANTRGGVLLIGVEDDGTITGAQPRHGQTTDLLKLRSAIFSNTVPNINTRTSLIEHSSGRVLFISVDAYPEPCATAAGKSLRSEGFREALNNAVLHRDYTRLDAVYVQWHPDHLLLTSPGGFPEGITVHNILVHEPKPRNPRLAEAFKRIGLIEQTGRGVDKIYMGQLRYGRPAPDYTRSDASGVRVVLRGGQASLQFTAFAYEQDKQGSPLALDELLVLNRMFFERRVDAQSAGELVQKGASEGRAVLERLIERGLVEARGERRGRAYHLAASFYRRFHMEAEYIRAKGFEPLQHEQMVLDYIRKHGRISRSEAADLCRLSSFQASRLLRRIAEKHSQVEMVGSRRGAHYVWQETGNERRNERARSLFKLSPSLSASQSRLSLPSTVLNTRIAQKSELVGLVK